ncbi:MAG TPA: type II toxin-antitoxin system VapB family antitoxin [Syntrophaceae bacterium]|nr:type II toxin-antitoxin system VapB family antitoxin [Syntrophaceae bacterium]
MRTTIVIDDGLLEELLAVNDFKNRSEAINEAIRDYVLRKKREKLLEMKGRIRFEKGHLERLRHAEEAESSGSTG